MHPDKYTQLQSADFYYPDDSGKNIHICSHPESRIKPLRITILAELSEWGGTEAHTVELACLLESQGHEITIVELGQNFCGTFFEKVLCDRNNRITIVRVNIEKPLASHGFMEIYRILRKLNGNICVFPKGSLHKGNLSLDLAARLLFSRYITIEHLACSRIPAKTSRWHLCRLLHGIGLWWYRHVFTHLVRSIWPSKIICVSNAVRNNLLEYGFPAKKLATVHNGIDLEKFRRFPRHRADLREAWEIPRDALVFGAVGRFNSQKGFDVAVRLFGELINSHPDKDMRLVLVGRGAMYNEISQIVADAGLEKKVILRDFTDSPWEIYSALDVFIMPSKNEGLPFALLEAMACYCTPVAMGVGGIPEVLNQQGLGWLVAPDDNSGFLRAMNDAAMSNTEKLVKMGQNARNHVASHYNANKQYLKIADLVCRDFSSSQH